MTPKEDLVKKFEEMLVVWVNETFPEGRDDRKVFAPLLDQVQADLPVKLATAAEAFFECPDDLLQVQATVDGYNCVDGKDIALRVTALNTPRNRTVLAVMAASVTIRGTRLDLSEHIPQQPPEAAEDADPQLDLETYAEQAEAEASGDSETPPESESTDNNDGAGVEASEEAVEPAGAESEGGDDETLKPRRGRPRKAGAAAE